LVPFARLVLGQRLDAHAGLEAAHTAQMKRIRFIIGLKYFDDLDSAPGWRNAVICLKARIILVILVRSHRKVGRCPQLFLSYISSIALQFLIIMKFVPSQGMIVLPEAEEALEGDNDERHLAAHLLDNQAFDFADVMASGVVDGCAFDTVAFDIAPRKCG
jgi:hypothetical protein